LHIFGKIGHHLKTSSNAYGRVSLQMVPLNYSYGKYRARH